MKGSRDRNILSDSAATISDAAAASAEQLALLPNLPAVNFGEQLEQIQRTLGEMQRTMQQHGSNWDNWDKSAKSKAHFVESKADCVKRSYACKSTP